MQKLEKIAMPSFSVQIPFYYRYVDDLCAAVPFQEIDFFLILFIFVFNSLKVEDSLNFFGRKNDD